MEDDKRAELVALLADASGDELEVVLGFARKIMGEGRSEYGALDVPTEHRSPVDALIESLDERFDAGFYFELFKLLHLLQEKKSLGTTEQALRAAVADRDREIERLKTSAPPPQVEGAVPQKPARARVINRCAHYKWAGQWCGTCEEYIP